MLKICKVEIRLKVDDLKEIIPLICTHHIYLEGKTKFVKQPQRRLNPNLQEVRRLTCKNYLMY